MKIRIILFLAIFLCISCNKEEEINIPQWLDELIRERQGTDLWDPASVYRYNWDDEYIYEFENPLSSCLYCEVYFDDGQRIDWSESSSENYRSERTNKTLIWDFSEQ